MKKIVTLVLAIALLMTSIVAIAESKAIPNINTFAKMTTKFIEGSDKEAKRYEIKLSKPVDKLWILWAEKGAEPDELAVDENLCATALAVEHKYMPGITQSIGKSTKSVTVEEYDWQSKIKRYYDPDTSEFKLTKVWEKYDKYEDEDPDYPTSPVFFLDEVKKEEEWTVVANYDYDKQKLEGYTIYVPTRKGYQKYTTVKTLEAAKELYELAFDGYTAEIKEPTKVVDGTTVIDNFGNKGEKVISYKNGSIQGTKTTTSVNKKLETNKATLGDRAFATLEGVTEDFAGWLVYRNRFGNFVKIEPYEGQI